MKMYICQHWQCRNSVPVFESVTVTADPVVTAPVVVSLVGAIVVNRPAEKKFQTFSLENLQSFHFGILLAPSRFSSLLCSECC